MVKEHNQSVGKGRKTVGKRRQMGRKILRAYEIDHLPTKKATCLRW